LIFQGKEQFKKIPFWGREIQGNCRSLREDSRTVCRCSQD